jgi:hypothetical protein
MKSSLKQNLFYSNLNNIPNLSTNLGFYLSGLIEGDGSIIVPKTIRNQKGKLLYLKRFITSIAYLSNTSSEFNLNQPRKSSPLHPYFVSGFVDGDGSFSVSILKRNKYKIG